ncbi:hypothetical protein BDA99DRAFT_330988 [Phascolomyces articulosus]|uniref:Uncharacterized protein n=1 Tax=Phascolomyces articulosus TaxID=60185 RepID=A0AAD5JLA4_9FUNG|nr:hypothetical protein BDA99DRAFT_330988 [Phascolomyces articulosus]
MMSDRPKSAGAQRISRGSMRSLRTALTDSNHHPRSMTPDAPPVPATSRSSMLRDWKNLTRRRSSGGQSPIDNHSTSGSSRGPSPLLTHRPILLDDTEVNHHPINNINNNNSITVTTTDNNQSLLLVEEKTTTFRNNNHLNGHQNNHSNHSIHSINDNNNNNNNNENINTDSNHPHHNNNTKSRFSRSLSNDPLLLPPSSSTSQKQKPHSYQPTRPPSSQGSIRSKAQNLVTSVIGRRNSHHQQQQQQIRAATATTGGLIRSKTFMMDHAGKLIQGADRHEKL